MKKVRDLMQSEVTTVSPDWPLAELERTLTRGKIGGAPVVVNDVLVGVISRSDVVRQMTVEQSLAEYVSDWYYEPGRHEERIGTIDEKVQARMDAKHVRDVMTRKMWTIGPDASAADAAKTMLEHRIHRLPVTEGDRLVGIVTTMDLLPLLAES